MWIEKASVGKLGVNEHRYNYSEFEQLSKVDGIIILEQYFSRPDIYKQ